ncbi:hypothetical protein CF326_g5452 [Tilletia indica]|nr:hypothetical protein CF326_g5452 [Tilletia indica]
MVLTLTMRTWALFILLLAVFTISESHAVKLQEYLTTVTVTYAPSEPTSVPEERDLSIVSTLTTTKTFLGRPATAVITKTVAVDNPMPTVVYYCDNMPQICKNTVIAKGDQPDIWLYDSDTVNGANRRRAAACPAPVVNFCKNTGQCDTKIKDGHDWRMSCDEAPPASFLNRGLGAEIICASYREQEGQRRILGAVSNLKAGDGKPYRQMGRAYPVVFSLDYSPKTGVSTSAYGAVIAGGASFGSGQPRTELTFEAPGPTAARTGTYNDYKKPTFVDWGFGGKKVECQPEQDTCKNERLAEPHLAVFSTVFGDSRPTPAPTFNRQAVAAAASSTCKSKSPRERSRDKARQARDDLDRVRSAQQVISGDSQFAKNVRDAAAAAAAAAILAASRAIDISYAGSDTDTNRQEVYDAANSALRADATLKTINDPKIQSLYSAVSSAAIDASSAANIASTFLPSPTAPAGQSQDGGVEDPEPDGNDSSGSSACISPGTSRVLGWVVRDGSVNSCYPKYNIKSSSASNGRLSLAFTGDGDSGFVGFDVDTSTSCKGVYRFSGDNSPVTQWAPFCSSSTNGEVVPYLDGVKLVSGLAIYQGVTLLAIAAKSQSALDCYAKSIVRGSFVNNGVYKITGASNCRLGQIPDIPEAALFNLSIPIPEETMLAPTKTNAM